MAITMCRYPATSPGQYLFASSGQRLDGDTTPDHTARVPVSMRML